MYEIINCDYEKLIIAKEYQDGSIEDLTAEDLPVIDIDKGVITVGSEKGERLLKSCLKSDPAHNLLAQERI